MRNKTGFSNIFLLVIVAVAALGVLAVIVVKDMFNYKTVSPISLPVIPLDEQVKKLEILSSSDEVGAIEKDTDQTSLDNLDQGITQAEKDLSGVQ